ncbi:MAG: F420-dependent NADP oxidoreductase [Bacteroidota bacterium]|nr:F420-dependent NADP oxidoreductase [Bacteroidota bacterium]
MKVVIVGSGNVANALGMLSHKAGHEILQVVSRNVEHAKELASKFDALYAPLTAPEFAEADIYIIALTDAALSSIEKISALKDKFIVHTAGSVSIDILKNCSSTYGVLYPLQTLTKLTEQFAEIPFLVEGNSKETLHRIVEFARTLSNNIILANEPERLHYHVAAVIVGNFTNHLYAITENFCEKENIDFKNLLPLINEVTARVNHHSPREVQTGPAIREDIFTINRHLQTLSAHPDLKYLYLKLSESILKLYEKH